MSNYEEGIMNEKELNISKESEKSNSLLIKSLEEGAINFFDLLKDKFYLSVIIFKNKNIFQISNKSILKIFNLFCLKGENIESLLSDYITFNILDENTSFKDDFINNNQDNSLGILDAPFIKLLEKTKIYIVSITSVPEKNKKLNYELTNNKINLKSKSINKICSFLGKTVYDISDYINILVLYLNDDDINKETIKSKIIDKYNKKANNFMGKKNYDFNLKIPLKNEKNVLSKYDDLFEKILNKIDALENNSSEYNQEENDNNNIDLLELNTPKRYIEQKIKINGVNYEDNEDDDKSELNKNKEQKCNCQKDICSACHIF